ncbi:hypothetical protein ACHWQZ_G007450 [Mnemiopsis leidyi]
MERSDIAIEGEHILNTQYNNTNADTYELNRVFTEHLQRIADIGLTKTKAPNYRKITSINKKPWFSYATRLAKQDLTRATEIVSEFPSSDYLRINFYRVKKTYKKLLTNSRNHFFDKLNTDIETGKVLNWTQFKKLKTQKSTSTKFDSLDMENFERFFKELYSNVHNTISPEKKAELSEVTARLKNLNCNSSTETLLNQPISANEIFESMSSLKNGEFAFDKRLPYEEQLRAKAVMLQLAATAAALKEPVTTTARDVLAQALWDEATRFEASQNVLGLPSPLRDALRKTALAEELIREHHIDDKWRPDLINAAQNFLRNMNDKQQSNTVLIELVNSEEELEQEDLSDETDYRKSLTRAIRHLLAKTS